MRFILPSGIRRKSSVFMPSSASRYAMATNGFRNIARTQLIAAL